MRFSPMVICLTALLCLGCQDTEIKHYKVPRVDESALTNSEVKPSVRLLAAILPSGDKMWFFKLVGPTEVMEDHKEDFDKFIRSVRFTAKGPEWTAPESWLRVEGSGLRYATFKLKKGEAPLELTVTSLERESEAGSILANVNRWRKQLGLRPTTEAGLDKIVKEEKIGDVTATLVDWTTAGSGKKTKEPLSYQTPAGWKKQEKAAMFSVATFTVSDANQTAEVTISPFPGDAGGLLENVNRWRTKQLALPAVTEEELQKDLKRIEVDGVAGSYVDLLGPAGSDRQRILGVMVPRKQTWFFKMRGPAALVEKQKDAFEAFVKSARFAEDEK